MHEEHVSMRATERRPTVDDVVEEIVAQVARRRAEEMIPINGEALSAKYGAKAHLAYEALANAQDILAAGLRSEVRRAAHDVLRIGLFQALTTTPNAGEGA